MRFNIRAKIIVAVTLSLVLMFGLIMYLLVSYNVSQLRTSLNQQSKSFASLATPPIGDTFLLYQESGSIRITQEVNKFLELDPDVTAIRIVSVDGKQLYSSQDKPGAPVSPKLASAFQPQYVVGKAGYIRQIVQPFFEDSGAHRYSIVYEISSQSAEDNIAGVIRLILYVGVVILIVSIIITTWLLNRLFIRPLRAVSHSANLISSGDFNRQIVSTQQDEIGELATSVNKMADFLKADIVKLREVDKLKSEFLMIASHNLRTPLTIMRGYIDMAESAGTVEELKKITSSIQDSVVRLHLLSEDLLTISTLEAGTETMTKSPVELARLVNATVSDFELLARNKNIQWEFDNQLPADAKGELNEGNMRSALGNIIDNAIKFTKEGGSVTIKAAIEGGQLVFTVTDSGIGIGSDELPKLFTKFHRGTSTLTYDYEGVGIGLYLTKLIVEKHGGRVDVHSETGKGSNFTVYVPLAATASTANAEPSAPPEPDGHPPVS